ncbi:MAG: hypothetical protein RL616_2493 [Verrucomicrobiota bacterium]
MKKLSAILLLFSLATALRAQDAVTTLAGQALVSGAANGTGTNAAFSAAVRNVATQGINILTGIKIKEAKKGC